MPTSPAQTEHADPCYRRETVQSNLYYRRFDQQHVDGNAAEVERCSGAAGNPLFNTCA